MRLTQDNDVVHTPGVATTIPAAKGNPRYRLGVHTRNARINKFRDGMVT